MTRGTFVVPAGGRVGGTAGGIDWTPPKAGGPFCEGSPYGSNGKICPLSDAPGEGGVAGIHVGAVTPGGLVIGPEDTVPGYGSGEVGDGKRTRCAEPEVACSTAIDITISGVTQRIVCDKVAGLGDMLVPYTPDLIGDQTSPVVIA